MNKAIKAVADASETLRYTLDHKDPVLEALEKLPPSYTNNSRAILQQKVERYRTNPNDRNAKELENLGLSVDHDDYRDRMGEFEQSDTK